MESPFRRWKEPSWQGSLLGRVELERPGALNPRGEVRGQELWDWLRIPDNLDALNSPGIQKSQTLEAFGNWIDKQAQGALGELILARVLDADAGLSRLAPKVSEKRVRYVVDRLLGGRLRPGESTSGVEPSELFERLKQVSLSRVGGGATSFNLDWKVPAPSSPFAQEAQSLLRDGDTAGGALKWPDVKLVFWPFPKTLEAFEGSVRKQLELAYQPLRRQLAWDLRFLKRYGGPQARTLDEWRSWTAQRLVTSEAVEAEYRAHSESFKVAQTEVEGLEVEIADAQKLREFEAAWESKKAPLLKRVMGPELGAMDADAREAELQRLRTAAVHEVVAALKLKAVSKTETLRREGPQAAFLEASQMPRRDQQRSGGGALVWLVTRTTEKGEILPLVSDPIVRAAIRTVLVNRAQAKACRELLVEIFLKNPYRSQVKLCSERGWACESVDPERLADVTLSGAGLKGAFEAPNALWGLLPGPRGR